MRRRVIGRDRDHPAEHRERFVNLALVPEGDAEIVAGGGMIGLDLQDAPVNILRLRQAPGLVMHHGLPQRRFELRRLRRYRAHRPSR